MRVVGIEILASDIDLDYLVVPEQFILSGEGRNFENSDFQNGIWKARKKADEEAHQLPEVESSTGKDRVDVVSERSF